MAPCLNLIETGTRTGRRCRTRRSDLRSAMGDAEITTRGGRSTSYEVRSTNCRRLERDLGRELHAAWSATSQERITDTYVSRCGEGVGTDVVPDRSRTRVRVGCSRISDEGRQDRTGKVRVI